jgi:hypothetical protein
MTPTPATITAVAPDTMIDRPKVVAAINRTSATLRRWIKAGKFPPPDLETTRESQYWRRSTLEAAGVLVA